MSMDRPDAKHAKTEPCSQVCSDAGPSSAPAAGMHVWSSDGNSPSSSDTQPPPPLLDALPADCVACVVSHVRSSRGRLALLRTCHALRRMVLAGSQHVEVKVSACPPHKLPVVAQLLDPGAGATVSTLTLAFGSREHSAAAEAAVQQLLPNIAALADGRACRLEIQDLRISSLECAAAVVRACRGLQQLRLHRCAVQDPSFFPGLAWACTALGSLSLVHVRLGDDDDDGPVTASLSALATGLPALQTLAVYGLNSAQALLQAPAVGAASGAPAPTAFDAQLAPASPSEAPAGAPEGGHGEQQQQQSQEQQGQQQQEQPQAQPLITRVTHLDTTIAEYAQDPCCQWRLNDVFEAALRTQPHLFSCLQHLAFGHKEGNIPLDHTLLARLPKLAYLRTCKLAVLKGGQGFGVPWAAAAASAGGAQEGQVLPLPASLQRVAFLSSRYVCWHSSCLDLRAMGLAQVRHVSVPRNIDYTSASLREVAELLGDVDRVDFNPDAAFDAALWEPGAEEGHNRLGEEAERLRKARAAAEEESGSAAGPTGGKAGGSEGRAEAGGSQLSLTAWVEDGMHGVRHLAPMARHIKGLSMACLPAPLNVEAMPRMRSSHIEALGRGVGAHLRSLELGSLGGFDAADAGVRDAALWEQLLLSLPLLHTLSLTVQIDQLGGAWVRQLAEACRALGRRLTLWLLFTSPKGYDLGRTSIKIRACIDAWCKEAQAVAKALAEAAGRVMEAHAEVPERCKALEECERLLEAGASRASRGLCSCSEGEGSGYTSDADGWQA